MQRHTTSGQPGALTIPRELDGARTLALVFGERSTLHDPAVFDDLRAQLPNSIIAGCSTAGHFIGEHLVDDLVVAVARFDDTILVQASVPLVDAHDSRSAGEQLAARLTCDDLQAVLVLSDGTSCNGTALVEGMVQNLPSDTVVFGGLAADGDAFVETATLDGDGAGSGSVTAIGFVGDRLVIGTGSKGGWDAFGPERTITKSENSVLLELDGEPALDLYARYLGDRADELPGSALLFPLAIREPDARHDGQVVRTVLGVDHADRSMTFAGDIPEGWRAQLMRASFDSLIDGAADASESIERAGDISGDALCFGVSCVGRRLVLGSRTEDELLAVVDELDDRTELFGFYSYGELAPGRSGSCELHNQTMTLTLIGER